MKKLLLILTGCLLLATTLMPAAAHASTQDFTIENFDANYYLERRDDGVPTMKVDELIQARFPEFDQNHGILRAIPASYKGQTEGIQILSVKDNNLNQDIHYTTYKQNGNLVLKIGDANSYVHGVVQYRIIYNVKNYISFYGDHDEFYWNVNGTQWQQPFAKVSATIHVPPDLTPSLLPQLKCYTGAQGSQAEDCSIGQRTNNGETEVLVSTLYSLPPGGNLSFVLGFKPGTFKVDTAAKRAKVIKAVALTGAIFLPALLVGIFMYLSWRKTGRDAKGRGTIVPQYVPPKGLNSLLSDIIWHEDLRQKAVTAMVIELAVKGYISIGEEVTDKLIGKKTDYTLTLLKAPDGLSTEERAVIEMFFNDYQVGSTVGLASLKNTMSGDFKRLSTNATDNLTSLGYFKANPAKAVNKYRGRGVSLLFVSFFGGIYLISISAYIGLVLLSLVLAGIVMIIFARYMSARTSAGVEAFEYLKGLKMYMQLAEADRLKYLQSPEGVRQWGDPSKPETKLKLFEKLLPYAIIFEIEKDWAKQFADVYTQAPDWYHGNWTSFNTGYLIGSIGSFNTANAVAFAPPASSSSSGFGGGGFSGGGGGGGGGGGW